MAEPIELPVGKVSKVGTKNLVLDGYAYWPHLVNTVERLLAAAISKCGNSACSQITLGNLACFTSFLI